MIFIAIDFDLDMPFDIPFGRQNTSPALAMTLEK